MPGASRTARPVRAGAATGQRWSGDRVPAGSGDAGPGGAPRPQGFLPQGAAGSRPRSRRVPLLPLAGTSRFAPLPLRFRRVVSRPVRDAPAAGRAAGAPAGRAFKAVEKVVTASEGIRRLQKAPEGSRKHQPRGLTSEGCACRRLRDLGRIGFGLLADPREIVRVAVVDRPGGHARQFVWVFTLGPVYDLGYPAAPGVQ